MLLNRSGALVVLLRGQVRVGVTRGDLSNRRGGVAQQVDLYAPTGELPNEVYERIDVARNPWRDQDSQGASTLSDIGSSCREKVSRSPTPT